MIPKESTMFNTKMALSSPLKNIENVFLLSINYSHVISQTPPTVTCTASLLVNADHRDKQKRTKRGCVSYGWVVLCRPTSPCLFGGVLPYFEVTGNSVPVSSQGLKCPDCFIWNCSYIVYISFKYKRAIQGQLPKVFLPMIGVPDGVICGIIIIIINEAYTPRI